MTTHPSSEAGPTVLRFDRTERAVHWTTAALVTSCVLTAMALSLSPVATLVGRRDLMREIHVVCGLLIPVPLLVGRFAPWATSLRHTFRELDRFDDDDRRWLRSFGRDPYTSPGKFHPGQKLNAALVAGALVLLYATGLVLKWYEPFSIDIRRGATFVHDWVAFLFVIDLVAHVAKALGDPVALRAMLGGSAPVSWAASKHPRWRVES